MEIKLHQDGARVERKPEIRPAQPLDLKDYSAPQLTKLGSLAELTTALPGGPGDPDPVFGGSFS